jgi:hypothetical protein
MDVISSTIPRGRFAVVNIRHGGPAVAYGGSRTIGKSVVALDGRREHDPVRDRS